MMRRFLSALFFLMSLGLGLGHQACAQDQPFVLDGEVFAKKFTDTPNNGNKLIELVRSDESFEKWTKLIGLRYQQLPKINNDPVLLAVGLARQVKAAGQPVAVLESEKKGEAIVDFIVGSNKEGFEFNVFRYVKSSDGRAVVSLQFAHRIADLNENSIPAFRKLREAWIKQVANFDMSRVQQALAELQ